MNEFSELTKWLVSADTAMVAVTFFICQVTKPLLPSPTPEIPGARPSRWDVVRQLQWIPLVESFVVAVILSVVFDPDAKEALLSKVRGGLQTGAYSVAVWETWSSVARPLLEKALGR